MNTVNSLAKKYFQERSKVVKKASEHPHQSQHKVFTYLCKKATKTIRGKYYGIEQIDSYEAFKERIPLHTYETMHHLLQRVYHGEPGLVRPGSTTLFAKSSGTTTGKSKVLPLTHSLLVKNHYAGGQDMLALYASLFPKTRLFSGKLFALGGAYEKHTDRTYCYEGDLSGLLARKAPKRIQQMRYPPPRFSRMYDREKKLEQLTRLSVKYNITCLAGIPSRISLLLENIENTHQKSIRDIRPNLEVFFHGGIPLGTYETKLKHLLPDTTFFCEVYNASEGYFAVQDQIDSKNMLLLTNRGIFYEFKDIKSGDICQLSEVETGKDYSLIISTPGGLRRYEIGDVIMFTDLEPYRIRIVGRTKLYANKYGEHVSVENIDRVIKELQTTYDLVCGEYTVGYSDAAHHRCIEIDQSVVHHLSDIATKLDGMLQDINDDYQIMRTNNCMLSSPKVTLMPMGTVQKWMESKGKLGGQHKFPRVATSPTTIEELLACIDSIA